MIKKKGGGSRCLTGRSKMDLRTARRVVFAGFGLMCICIVICGATKLDLFAYVGIGIGAATMIFWVIFGRCPECRKFIRRSSSKVCPNCGKPIDWKGSKKEEEKKEEAI